MNVFETILLITFASLGFRAITDKGMILYFIRSPFDRLSDRKKEIDIRILKIAEESSEDSVEFKDVFKSFSIKFVLYMMKPVMLCSTCMASLHTLLWYYLLNLQFNMLTIVVMLSVAFLNTLLWSLTQLISKSIK